MLLQQLNNSFLDKATLYLTEHTKCVKHDNMKHTSVTYPEHSQISTVFIWL